MAESVVFTPYSTASSLFGQNPSWVADPLDQQRLLAYDLYEKIYWNLSGVFVLSMRGTEDNPLYVPSGRTIIDTSNRFTAPGYAVSVSDRLEANNNKPDVIAARMVLNDLMRRERFKSKFNGAKRYCQIQGDWVWHITADPTKEAGSRISMTVVDPSHYFPVEDPNNVDRKIAVFLAEPVEVEGTQRVRRVCYRKNQEGEGPVTITVEEGLFAVETWQDLDATPVTDIRPVTQFPPEVTAIPVYHVKNFEEPGNPFGSSELRGFERLIAGLHQTMTDEDLTLALQGLGMYATDAPQPVDPVSKLPVPWRLGPGRVVHRPEGTSWERVAGVTAVTPFGDHYDRIWQALKQASASPDVAVGTVDVQIAQSGIALALQLSPIIAKASEKNDLIIEPHDQMWFDLINMWYPAFEDTEFADVLVQSVVGDAVPVDRERRFAELNDMLDKHVIDTQYYRDEASKLGYVFPEDIGDRAAAEAKASDPFANRVDTELNDDGAE